MLNSIFFLWHQPLRGKIKKLALNTQSRDFKFTKSRKKNIVLSIFFIALVMCSVFSYPSASYAIPEDYTNSSKLPWPLRLADFIWQHRAWLWSRRGKVVKPLLLGLNFHIVSQCGTMAPKVPEFTPTVAHHIIMISLYLDALEKSQN